MRIWYQGLSSPDRKPTFYKRLEEYAKRVAAPGTEVAFHGLSTGGVGDNYRFIELLDTIPLLANGLKAEREGYDAFAIGNTLDPGVYEAREVMNIPVVAFLETALAIASMMGRNFALLAPGAKFVPKWEEVVARYGYSDRLVCITNMDFTPQALEPILEPENRESFLELFRAAAKPAIDRGAEVLIPVGGAVVMYAGYNNIREIDGVPVFDGIAALIKMTELMVQFKKATGSAISRKLKYASPPSSMLHQVLHSYGINVLD